MKKVIFLFAGTGDSGLRHRRRIDEICRFKKDVIRIYIKGCQGKAVGNSLFLPDLERAAANIRNAFHGSYLNFNRLKTNLKDSCVILGPELSKNENGIEVANITLEGFSRGAITTFAVAKKLNDLGIPIHIIANQPVPGETWILNRLRSRYMDLTNFSNIKSSHVFLGSYDLKESFLHNLLFRQMVPNLPIESNPQIILCPHPNHLDWSKHSSPILHHVNKIMATIGLTDSANDDITIRTWYQNNKNWYFTPSEFMQPIYGSKSPIGKDPIYLNWVADEAQEILKSHHIEKTMSGEQTSAILALAHLMDNKEDKINEEWYKLILTSSNNGEKFIKIINKVTEICDYLPHILLNVSPKKLELLASYTKAYKKAVFADSFNFLSINEPTITEKKYFAANICHAEKVFIKQTAAIDYDNLRFVFLILSNIITHITGLALIINTVHKIKTGNWLLFSQGPSENALKALKLLFKEKESPLVKPSKEVFNFLNNKGLNLFSSRDNQMLAMVY